jgi:hypothetical protein
MGDFDKSSRAVIRGDPQRRCRLCVPVDLAKVISETFDHDKLNQWFDVAATTDSLNAFRAATGLANGHETNGIS